MKDEIKKKVISADHLELDSTINISHTYYRFFIW